MKQAEYEKLDVPRPVWWLLLSALCLLFALIFLVTMATYLRSPALECDPIGDTIECDEISGAPAVFAAAAGVMGLLALLTGGVFVLTGGMATLPWVRERLRGFYRAVRGRRTEP